MAKFVPCSLDRSTFTLDDAGATMETFLEEQTISQVPHPVHFLGLNTITGGRLGSLRFLGRGRRSSMERYFSGLSTDFCILDVTPSTCF